MKYKICCKEDTSLILEPNPKHLKQVKLSVGSYNRRNSNLAYTCLWFSKTFFFFAKIVFVENHIEIAMWLEGNKEKYISLMLENFLQF